MGAAAMLSAGKSHWHYPFKEWVLIYILLCVSSIERMSTIMKTCTGIRAFLEYQAAAAGVGWDNNDIDALLQKPLQKP